MLFPLTAAGALLARVGIGAVAGALVLAPLVLDEEEDKGFDSLCGVLAFKECVTCACALL